MRDRSGGSALAEFEQIYRRNVGVVTAYFARRCADPQTVADLTSETIVRAANGFGSFDPQRGTARGVAVRDRGQRLRTALCACRERTRCRLPAGGAR